MYFLNNLAIYVSTHVNNNATNMCLFQNNGENMALFMFPRSISIHNLSTHSLLARPFLPITWFVHTELRPSTSGRRVDRPGQTIEGILGMAGSREWLLPRYPVVQKVLARGHTDEVHDVFPHAKCILSSLFFSSFTSDTAVARRPACTLQFHF